MTRLILSGHVRGEHVYVDVWLEDGDSEKLVGAKGLMLTLDQWHELRNLDSETEGAIWATTNAEFEDSIGREIGDNADVPLRRDLPEEFAAIVSPTERAEAST